MIRSHFYTGIILLLITLSLSYWLYNTKTTTNESAVKGEAVSDIKSDDPVNDKDPSSAPVPSTEIVTADVTDPDLPRLFGTTITNKDKIAIFQDPFTKSTGTYRIDDSVAGFIVLDIQQYKAILLRGNKEFEVALKNPEDFETDPPISAEITPRTIKRPRLPILPFGRKWPPQIESRFSSEETMTSEEPEGEDDSEYIHPRFWRRPEYVYDDSRKDLTPPIAPTFGDDKVEIDTENEADTEKQ